MAKNRSKRILETVLGNDQDQIPRKKEKVSIGNSNRNDRSERKGQRESPIPKHNEEDLIQLQDLLGHIFDVEKEVDNFINDDTDIISLTCDAREKSPQISPEIRTLVPSHTPENSRPTEISTPPTVTNSLCEKVADHEDPHNILSTSPSATNPPFENDTAHVDQRDTSNTPVSIASTEICQGHCNNAFCASCSTEQTDTAYEYTDTDAQTPSTLSVNSPFTPSTSGLRKKSFKMDKGKKRKLHRENWMITQRKKNKNLGKSYMTAKGKLIPEKSLKDPCSEKCRLKCYNALSNEQRLHIYNKFWSLGERSLQWKYVINYTDKIAKCRRTTKVTKHDRQNTFVYYLPSGHNTKIKVCKTMFLNTIASGERIISTAWKKNQGYDILEPDNRGRYDHKKTIIDDEMVKSVCDHVNSFPLVESHYIRKDSTKLYLDGINSVSRMYKLYDEWSELDKYSNRAHTKRQYRDIVNENFNIAFHRPKKDCCDICHAFSNKADHTEEDKKKQEEHLNNKKTARLLKSEDKKESLINKKLVVATFDFQKVLTSPHGEVSILYYKRKLSTFNFTVYNVADKKGLCYMWHEVNAKRGANEVSSCLYRFIKEEVQKGVQEFRFWSDNCGGQNRNRIVFSLYMLAAKEFNVTITHRFLEKGHTQNEGDSVHATIERASKGKMIYAPEEWYCLVRWAKSEGDPYIVQEMATNDFYDFKSILTNKNWAKNICQEKIYWNRVKEIKVNRKQYDRIEYKYELCEPSKTVVVLRCATRNAQRFSREFELKNAYQGPLSIRYDKYKDLRDMCQSGVIPEKYHKFYEDLPHTNRFQRNQTNVPSDLDETD